MSENEVVIRVSRGVGSSPKWWLVATIAGRRHQVGEADRTPCRLVGGGYVADPSGGISGYLVRPGDESSGRTEPRKLYADLNALVAETEALWPGARFVRADDERLIF